MTIENTTQTVRLSFRDWIAIGTIALSILASTLGVFIHHDRMLVELVVQQQMTNQRLDKIEAKLERKFP